MEKIVRKIELKALNVRVENENYWSVILQATVSGDGNIAIVDKEVVFKADRKEIAKVRTNEFGEAITEPLLFSFELEKVDFIAQISGYVLNSFVLVYTPAPSEVDLAIDKKLIAVYADKKQVWDVVIKAAYQNKLVPDLKIVFVKGNEVFSEVTDKSGQIKKQLELYLGETFVIRALKRQDKQEIAYLELPEQKVTIREEDFYVDDNGSQVTKMCVVVEQGIYPVVEQWVLFQEEGNVLFLGVDSGKTEAWVKTDKDGCARKLFSIIDCSGQVKIAVDRKWHSTLSYCNLDLSMNVVGFEVKDGGKQENRVEVFVKKEGRPVVGQEVDFKLSSSQTITKKTDKNGCIKDSYTLYGPNGGQVEIGLKGEKPECFISHCRLVLKFFFKAKPGRAICGTVHVIYLNARLYIESPFGVSGFCDCRVVFDMSISPNPLPYEDLHFQGVTDFEGKVSFHTFRCDKYDMRHPEWIEIKKGIIEGNKILNHLAYFDLCLDINLLNRMWSSGLEVEVYPYI